MSAGILLFRVRDVLEVLLVHPGGPFWAKKDLGAWSIPKGELAWVDGRAAEDPLAAARREFEEELGVPVVGDFVALTPVRQKGGKTVLAWAVRGDFDPAALRSNTFRMEWPPRSGREREFPEVDRAAWFALAEARARINPGQVGFLEELERIVSAGASAPDA